MKGDASDAESGGLEELMRRFPDEDPRILKSHLDLKSGKVEEAHQHYVSVLEWRKEIGDVTIRDIEPFLRSGTYMIPLEYEMKQAPTTQPIILLNGMIRGTREQMVKQVIYCVERAWALMPPGEPRVRFIVNTRNSSFRIPDSDYRAAVFNTMRYHYPWLINCLVIFIDVPGPIAAGLQAVGKMFDKVYTDRFRLAKSSEWSEADTDLKAFAETAPPSRLPVWDAKMKLSYDVEAYIADRKAAEGLGSFSGSSPVVVSKGSEEELDPSAQEEALAKLSPEELVAALQLNDLSSSSSTTTGGAVASAPGGAAVSAVTRGSMER